MNICLFTMWFLLLLVVIEKRNYFLEAATIELFEKIIKMSDEMKDWRITDEKNVHC